MSAFRNFREQPVQRVLSAFDNEVQPASPNWLSNAADCKLADAESRILRRSRVYSVEGCKLTQTMQSRGCRLVHDQMADAGQHRTSHFVRTPATQLARVREKEKEIESADSPGFGGQIERTSEAPFYPFQFCNLLFFNLSEPFAFQCGKEVVLVEKFPNWN